jgi:hypothetical protein
VDSKLHWLATLLSAVTFLYWNWTSRPVPIRGQRVPIWNRTTGNFPRICKIIERRERSETIQEKTFLTPFPKTTPHRLNRQLFAIVYKNCLPPFSSHQWTFVSGDLFFFLFFVCCNLWLIIGEISALGEGEKKKWRNFCRTGHHWTQINIWLKRFLFVFSSLIVAKGFRRRRPPFLWDFFSSQEFKNPLFLFLRLISFRDDAFPIYTQTIPLYYVYHSDRIRSSSSVALYST